MSRANTNMGPAVIKQVTPSNVSFRALGFGDPHLALPAPGTRNADTFRMETEELFEQILQTADLAKVHAVFCPGDWFHLKASTSYETVRWAMSLLRPIVDRYGPVLTIPGNHDMVGSNVAEASTRQPISVLEAAGLIRRVDLSPYEVIKDGQKFQVSGQAYPHVQRCSSIFNVPQIVIMHGDVVTANQAEAILRPGYNQESTTIAVVNGHIHTPDFGLVRTEMNDKERLTPRLFAPLGTLSRVARPEASWTPRCVVVTLTAAGCKATFVELNPRCPGLSAFVADSTPASSSSAASLRDFARYLASHGNDAATDPAKMLLDFCFDDAGRSRYPAGVYEKAKQFLEDAKP